MTSADQVPPRSETHPEGNGGSIGQKASEGEATMPGVDQVGSVDPHVPPVISRTGMWSEGTGDTSGYSRIHRSLSFPPPSPQPYGGYFDEVAERVFSLVPDLSPANVVIAYDMMTFFISREQLLALAKVLRDDPLLRFEVCLSVMGINFPEDEGAELHAVYSLLSMTHNRRLSLEVPCSDKDPHIPSVVSVYPMADFHERETWDMFGIIFDGHPSLTRILMPDDWPGHPQRKDYPLGGIPVEFKGAVVAPADQRRKYF